MADIVQTYDYFALGVPDKAGEGQRILAMLAREGVDLVAFSGFPTGAGKAQLDIVPADAKAFAAAAQKLKLRPRKAKTVFLVQGDDRVGAVAQVLARTSAAKIQLIAAQALAAGAGRWAMMLWVKPGSVEKARRAFAS